MPPQAKIEKRPSAAAPFRQGTIQRKLLVENKPVDALPDWISQQYSSEICTTLSNWIAAKNGLTFTFSAWSDAIRGAAALNRAVLSARNEEPEIERIKRLFSNEISQISSQAIITDSPQQKAAEFATLLAEKQQKLQKYLNEHAPGYVALVRFYVKDHNVGKTHPGLNSWAFLEQQKNPGNVRQLYANPRETAISHMLYGHDTDAPNGQEVITGSPFISTTTDVNALLKADSPYNPDRNKALQSNIDFSDKLAMSRSSGMSSSSGPAKGSLRRQIGKASVANNNNNNSSSSQSKSGMAMAQKNPGKHLSDKIVALTYGHRDAVTGHALYKVHVATHIAFLAVPPDRVHTPSEDIPPNSCCVLEKECTIFAPSTDLSNWLVAEVNNRLPDLTGRAFNGRRLGTDRRFQPSPWAAKYRKEG